MGDRLPTAYDVIRVIKKMIAEEGVAVFETNGRIQLYSGPLNFITNALDVIDNHDRAIIQAGENTTLIEQTPAGRKLDRYEYHRGIYEYFKSVYGPRSPKAYYHADKVMRFASREFAKACYGNVETSVCGAGLDRVFFEAELPELIKNQRIETINDVPMQRIREIYQTQGAYVAYREICKAELNLSRKKVEESNTPENREDLRDRLQFFKRAKKDIFDKIRKRDKKTMERLGPIQPRVEIEKPVRYMHPKTRASSCSVQYG